MDEFTDKPIFVSGCPKSGTSLVAQLLSNHPDIKLDFDLTVSWYFLDYWMRCQTDPTCKMDASEDPLNAQADLLTHGAHDYISRDYFSKLHSGYYKNKRWGSSCKPILFHMKTILSWFPQAIFVLVLRDPRDVWCSIQHAKWTGQTWHESIEKFCNTYWKFAKYHANPHVVTLRYEDIIDDPTVVYKKLNLEIPKDYLIHTDTVFKYRSFQEQTPSVLPQGQIVDRRKRWLLELSSINEKEIRTRCTSVFDTFYKDLA